MHFYSYFEDVETACFGNRRSWISYTSLWESKGKEFPFLLVTVLHQVPVSHIVCFLLRIFERYSDRTLITGCSKDVLIAWWQLLPLLLCGGLFWGN